MPFATCSAFQAHLLFLIIVGQPFTLYVVCRVLPIAYCNRSSSLSSSLISCWLTIQCSSKWKLPKQLSSAQRHLSSVCKLAGPLDSRTNHLNGLCVFVSIALRRFGGAISNVRNGCKVERHVDSCSIEQLKIIHLLAFSRGCDRHL